MTNDDLAIVCFVLAHHLDADPEHIYGRTRLEEDLGLDPLDLILIVLRLEELTGIELQIADLEGLRTVADLVDMMRSSARDTWLRRAG